MTYKDKASNVWSPPCKTFHVHSRARASVRAYTPDMGWLRLVGFLKWPVSFAEYSLFYRALLQTRPIILRSLLIVATLYDFVCVYRGYVLKDLCCAWYRVAMTHTMHYLDRLISAKEPCNQWLFCEKRLNLRHPMHLRHPAVVSRVPSTLQHAATRCNMLQHAATNSSTQQHSATTLLSGVCCSVL